MRTASVTRKTAETVITAEVCLDGGSVNISTGIGFFDHMLTAFAVHSGIGLTIEAKGDLYVDGHHTVEDTGIVLGQAIAEAIGDKKGIKRYGSFILPMDDALVLCAIDLCGRPYFQYDLEFPTEKIGEFDAELVREFFYAISYKCGMNLHMKMMSGVNSHHIAEAAFKAFAKALDQATSYDERIEGILSTKGSL